MIHGKMSNERNTAAIANPTLFWYTLYALFERSNAQQLSYDSTRVRSDDLHLPKLYILLHHSVKQHHQILSLQS